MRDIKFRGKSIKGFGYNHVGTWFYGGIITNPHGNEVHIAYFDKEMLSWYNVPVDPETVGQYIFQDKNGNEIYLGQRVKYQRIKYTDCSRTEIERISDPIFGHLYYSEGLYLGFMREKGGGMVFLPGTVSSEDFEVVEETA